MSNEKDDRGRSQAAAQYRSICEMVAALEVDYDRLEELRDQRDELNAAIEAAPCGDTRRIAEATLTDWDDAAELKELENLAGDCTDRDDAERRIHEDALSVEVRSDWVSYGDQEHMDPHEFRILLCTGGPAVQIHGELNQYGEPCRAWLEYQDCGTPWTEIVTVDEEAVNQTLLAYARCFYFGEG